MRKHLLFLWDCYEAVGGWGDFVKSFDTIREARDAAEGSGKDSAHIVDRDESAIMERGRCQMRGGWSWEVE
ncbi:MAG: hypothetical protein A2V88_02780 [Elusimicrobia bacterium RBG_16_66_12]|nr:MAG: hypothetical protein A2V88_02780 [Elusimicrobia bacterium RBG_16_66_12]